jgi:eukaryotic-like serine/threonine-protein kinase
MATTDGARQRAEALIGRVIADRYRIDRIVAMGGMGAVYAGEHVHMHKKVAIKLLHPETEGLGELVARFERESIVGAHAVHRNVAIATDFGRDADGSYYLVSELVDGINLKELMRRGPVPLDRAVDIARQLVEGLVAIHKLDIVHRDLNPRNVMVSDAPPDRVKLIDFGFAKVPVARFLDAPKDGAKKRDEEDALRLTAAGVVFGTVGFMAPEAAMGMAKVDKPADLYAVGVILYEMLTGLHPYEATDQKKLFRCHAFDPPPTPSERAPDVEVPEAFAAICMRLLEKDPDERYASAADLLAALDDALRAPASLRGDLPAHADDSPWTQRQSPSQSSKKPWVALLLLGAAAAGVATWRSGAFETATADPSPATSTTAVTAPSAPSAPVEPSATSSASASATASAAPTPVVRPSDVDGIDAKGWAAKLRQAVAGRAAADCAKAIRALATIEPERLGAHDLVAQVALGAVSVSISPEGDALFELLSSPEIGTAGPDVLYRLVAFHGGSNAAKRATELLADPRVLAQASPGMRIARELHRSPCQQRRGLLERAGKEGDRRALLLLSNMTPRDCSSCCLHAPELAPAMRAINARTKK